MRRLAVRLLAVALFAPLLAACGDTPAQGAPGAIAFVVGGRSNMPSPALLPRAKEMLRTAVLSKSSLYIVGVSGRPEILYTEHISHDCDSKAACDAVVDQYGRRISALMTKVKAKTTEADTLGAVLLAARALQGARGSGERQIVVIDSGLQTTGDMPLQAPGALSVQPQQLVQPWIKDAKLKNLNGVHVLMNGVGSYRAPQEALPQDLLAQLETLWQTVLEAGDATVDIDTTPLPLKDTAIDLPAVSVVPVGDKPVDNGNGCFRIRDDQIGFLPGRADFKDSAKALEVLKPIAAELKSKQLTATVIGTTALPEDPPYQLSNRRARAVVDMLTSLGVPRHTLTPGGVGTRFAGFVPDTNAQGELIETLATQNRLVIIQPVGRACS